jgi:3',5'-cyclic AMP phosphodiesterase CpdA
MYTLAHLSDVHLGGLGIPRPGALFSKRILGLLSWHLRRKAVHRGAVLAALVADLHQSHPDHTAITGDLVNISLPEEFRRAAAWLATLGRPADVSVIPGNHDAYVAIPWDRSLALWDSYMSGDRAEPAADAGDAGAHFPYLRRRGPLALIGLSTAVPMPPHMAAGRLGTAQLQRLEALLATTKAAGVCRTVLIHHPPTSSAAYRHKQLLDGEAFSEVLTRQGAELVLHGHTHMSGLSYLKTPEGRVPVVGVPSASARPTRNRDHSRYHLYRIVPAGEGWRIEVEVRGLAPSLDRFQGEAGFSLSIPV